MSGAENNYHLLIQKLDQFIRKYYKNVCIKGILYILALITFSFITVTFLEYYFYLGTTIRAVLFYTFLGGNLFAFIKWVFIPVLAYYKLGPIISHDQAAQIIGNHFQDIKDRLLNTLQLHELALENKEQGTLIEAGINQKINQLRFVQFTKAIDLSKNKIYIKYVAPPLAIIIVILFTAPSIITESTKRILNYNTYYEKPAPFLFNILNKKLEAIQGDDYTLKLKMTGNEIPQDIYILVDENRYKLEKGSIILFNHTFKNLQKNKKFRFIAGGFSSKEYELHVLPKPTVLRFDVQLLYPNYLHKKPECISNVGDITVPQGTQAIWTFYTEKTDSVSVKMNGLSEKVSLSENRFFFSKKLMKNTHYTLQPKNKFTQSQDSLSYSIQVIPDLVPTISVQQKEDSLSEKVFYFIGSVKDDYGFSKLTFHYKKITDGEKAKTFATTIPVSKNKNQDQFFYYWNLKDLTIQPGETVEYYFEVFDNDGVNGAKSARSTMMTMRMPTSEEIDKKIEQNNASIKDKVEETIKQAEQIQREAKKLTEKLINKKTISFEEKKQVGDLIEKQKRLEETIEDIKNQNEKNNINERDFKPVDETILDKKKKIEELFNDLLDEKTKDLIQKLEKLLEQNNKQLTQEQLQKMQLENKDLEKELERTLELFKQLEFEQKLNEKIDQLNELSEKQEKLSQESNQKNANSEKLSEKQKNLNKEFEQIKEDLKELENKNQALEEPQDFNNPKEEMQSIEEDMNKSTDDLQNNKSQKAAQSQKRAAEKMEQLAQKMKAQQAEMQMQELDINMKALREILENLVKVSFDQENVMEELKKTNINDPKYLTLTQKQRALKDDLKMIEDSIFALSKKVIQIQSFVNKEIANINQNAEKSLENLGDRRTGEAASRQQYVMTSVNNLAVMLSEVLQQMQQEMMDAKENAKPGSKPNSKPGKKPGGQSLSKMQEQLNKQMEELKNGMKPGEKPGKGQMSEQLARMAAQQQAIRNALQQLEKEMGKDGKNGNASEINKLKKEMEKTETDLYNKNITQEMLNRQRDIMTRLLEAEKSAREREYDNKREAESGKEKPFSYDKVFEEYQKQKNKELELFKTIPPSLNLYYKNKVNDYFEHLNQNSINQQ